MTDPAPARLLLIDDDRKLVRLLTSYLQSQGFEVGAAYDGAEGIARIRAEEWDLVVLDVMLPRVDGFGVLRQLRECSAVPVLMLTGRGAEDDLVTGFEGGADDYIPKTTSARELTVRIRALLRRAALREQEEGRINSGPQQSIEVGTLSLNPEARRVLVAGAPVSLTSLEFELLAALMKNRGRVRSREQLMNEVQDRKFDSFDRSIDVHIASLRRKLGDDSRSARFIRTVRGIGYVLVDPERASP